MKPVISAEAALRITQRALKSYRKELEKLRSKAPSRSGKEALTSAITAFDECFVNRGYIVKSDKDD